MCKNKKRSKDVLVNLVPNKYIILTLLSKKTLNINHNKMDK